MVTLTIVVLGFCGVLSLNLHCNWYSVRGTKGYPWFVIYSVWDICATSLNTYVCMYVHGL